MRPLILVSVLCLLVVAVSSLPNNGRSHHQAKRRFNHRPPSAVVGEKLRAWNPAANMGFPHEMGADEYEEFDIMYPPYHEQNFEYPDKHKDRWTDNKVPFIFNGTFTASELTLIKSVMAQFNDNTCVKFVPRTNEPHFLTIDNSGSGCWSHVGMWFNNNYNLLNLQSSGCMYAGSIAHEMMHTLGFHHEMVRPDRDEWIRYDVTALQLKRQTDQWIETNFGILDEDQVDLFGIPYNYGSVMHYSRYAGAWNNTRPVIYNLKPWDQPDFGSKTGLAPVDILAIKRAYNCPV